MGKFSKTERDSRKMAREILRDPKFSGLIYIGRPLKGSFYVRVDRCLIRREAIKRWNLEDVTPRKISRLISILRDICKLENLEGSFRRDVWRKLNEKLDELP